MNVIDGYLLELRRTLHGPRQVKADLLDEARDGLTDAAEAYEQAGCSRAAAEHEAVTEFGAVPEVAPGYQRLLAFAQARRTVLLVFLVSSGQSLASTYGWQSGMMAWTSDPGVIYQKLGILVDWLGIGLKVLALVALLLCGIGLRYLGPRQWIPRAVGWFAVVFALFSFSACVFLTSGFSVHALLREPLLVTWAGIGILPAVLAAWSGRRCLAAT